MKPARILVVEDEALTGRAYQSTLIQMGYSVPAVVGSGEEALGKVQDLDPDLILLNLHLSGDWDGIKTAHAIQSVSEAPILFISGADDDVSINRARATYPYGYLVKPVTDGELQHAVAEALKKSEKLRAGGEKTDVILQTLQSLDLAVLAADLAGNLIFLNRKAEELTGWPHEEAIGMPLRSVFQVQGTSRNGAHPPEAERQASLQRRDGSTLEILDQSAPLQDDGGALSGMVVIFRPAEEESRPQAAADLPAEDELATIAQSISDPLFTLDAGWRITHANAEGAVLLGVDRASLLGTEFWQSFTPEERAECLPVFEQALQENRPQSLEFQHLANQVWLSVQLYPFADGLLVILHDISQRKLEEGETKRRERLESLGLLARGFAHDFNNLLTVLLGNLSLAQQDPSEENLRDKLDSAIEATLRAQSLVQQLMTFARGGAPIRGDLDPIALLKEVAADRQKITPGIHIHTVNDAEGVRVEADPKQLRRVLENIFTNAEQAMRGEGSIFVRCRLDPNDPTTQQDLLVIEVIDSGEGMDAETLGMAFEPFYTKHPEDNATGLGLTVCDLIARAHGGFVRLQSKPGKGTIASIHLPYREIRKSESVSQNRNANILTSSHCTSSKGGDSKDVRILVLEDETRISKLIHQTLSLAGYDVLETATGDDAIEAFRTASQSGNPFDVLIVDLTLKDGMGGIEALKRIKEIDSEVCAIVSSGYNDDPAMADPASYGFVGALPKPYEPQQLLEVVGQLAGKV